MNIFQRIIKWFKKLPGRKQHLDFLAALLSIPVLLTVVTLNIMNLQDKKKTVPPQNSTAEKQIIIQEKNTASITPQPTGTPSACKKEIGPIDIAYPRENQTVNDNPVSFIINYKNQDYCSVVWSYRINNSSWSEYNANSPVIYNMPSGDIKFELRVQSTASNDQSLLERNFNYQGNTIPTPTSTISGSLK